VASQLARRLGIARAPRLLRKVIETPSQASLSREQRLTNFSDAFSTDRKARPGQRVILIDDVVTTGATVSACIRALAAANLGVVEIWALSHTPFESRP
jgi:predicted amidophosphoribosyltransferase